MEEEQQPQQFRFGVYFNASISSQTDKAANQIEIKLTITDEGSEASLKALLVGANGEAYFTRDEASGEEYLHLKLKKLPPNKGTTAS